MAVQYILRRYDYESITVDWPCSSAHLWSIILANQPLSGRLVLIAQNLFLTDYDKGYSMTGQICIQASIQNVAVPSYAVPPDQENLEHRY